MCWNNDGRLFHSKGAATEKVQSMSLVHVQTLVTALRVAD